jgi:uncharacterized protein YdbL (DUF1318 family)
MRSTRTTRIPDARRLFLVGLLALALAPLVPGHAVAADALDAAKVAGHLGERFDGYLGVVSDSAPASAKALAADINTKRKAHYAQIAAKEGTQVDAVAAIAGAKLVQSAPSGQYVMPGAGAAWKRVP